MSVSTGIKLLAAMLLCCATTSINAEPTHARLGMPTDPNAVLFSYDSQSGDIWITRPEESTSPITTLEIKSQSLAFNTQPCHQLVCGLFDVWGTGGKIFRLDPTGFDELHVDGALDPGLTSQFLVDDLSFDGSLLQGGGLPEVVIPIPEPTSGLLALLGTTAFLFGRRS